MKNLILLISIFFLTQNLNGQFQMSGYVMDAKSKEALPGANVTVLNSNQGTTSNSEGYYTLNIPEADSSTIVISYLGYTSVVYKGHLTSNIREDFDLIPSSYNMNEIVVLSNAISDRNVAEISTGRINVPVKYIHELPALLGEVDALKVIQLLPGVSAGQEGSTGIYVRGGNADQNLYLMDDVPIYQPGHLLGIVSTFNAGVIKDVQLTKSGFSAKHGGRLSSIIELNMKEGNKGDFSGNGSLGLLNSSLTLEGPIANENTSFILSGRRTYADVLAKPFIPKKSGNGSIYFYDVNAGIHTKLGDRDQLALRYFQGRDVGNLLNQNGGNYDLGFGNRAFSGHWNKIWTSKLSSSMVAYQSNFFHNFDAIQNKTFSHYYSDITDNGVKLNFDYYNSNSHSISFGAQYINHRFGNEGIVRPQTSDVSFKPINLIPEVTNQESAIYIDDKFSPSTALGFSVGGRVAHYKTANNTYTKFEPRFSTRYLINPESSIKASLTRMHQFVHLITGSTSALPTEIWIPSSSVIKPQISDQVSLGYFKNFSGNQYETSLEIYGKRMNNQVLFREGAILTDVTNYDDEVSFGKGESYGVEVYFKKNTGKLTGWVSYTLSKTTQQFDDINGGESFPFKFDRRHNLAIVGLYKLNERWNFGGNFVYYSGSSFSIPTGRFFVENGGSLHSRQYPIYTDRNNYQLPAHHRLDVSATRSQTHKLFGKEYDSKWVFSIYNVYSRLNAFFVYTDVNIKTNKPIARQVSLLPIVPSINYQFEF